MGVSNEMGGGWPRWVGEGGRGLTLVLDEAGSVDGSGGLGDVLEVVSLEDDLVLLGLGLGDGDTLEHGDLSDDLLSCKEANTRSTKESTKEGEGGRDDETYRGSFGWRPTFLPHR